MPLSTRELYLIFKAKDEVSSVLNGMSRQLLAAGAAAQVASERSAAAALRAQAAQMRATGATRDQINAVLGAARAHDANARAIQESTARTRQFQQGLMSTSAVATTVGITLVAAGAATLSWLNDSIHKAKDYEKAVKLTKTQVDGFSASLEELSTIGKNVAKDIAVPFEQIQPALFDIFSSTNANVKQSEILLRGFAKAAVAGNTTIQAAARETIAVMNAYNIPLEDVNKVLDIQFQLVRKGVGTYEEFSKVVGNVIPSSTRAGQTFEMVGAMLAYMTRNGLSAAAASTSAARAMEAMSHPKTVERLKEMGINAYDATGKFRPLNEVLQDLRKKLDAIPPADRVATLVELFKGAGGTIQARRFLEQVLLKKGELEEFSGFLKDMQNATGAFGNAYDAMADTAAAKSQLLANKWEVLRINVGEKLLPVFEKLVDWGTKVVDWFNSLDPGTQKAITLFVAISAAVLIVLGVFALLVGAIAGIVAAFAAIGVVGAAAIAGFIVFAAQIALCIFMIKQLWKNSETFRDVVKEVWAAIKRAVDGGVAAWKTFVDWVKANLVPIFNDVVNTVKKNLQPAFDDIAKFFRERFVPAIHQIEEAFTKMKPFFDQVAHVVGNVLKLAFENLGFTIKILSKVIGWLIQAAVALIGPVFSFLVKVIVFVITHLDWLVKAFKIWWGFISFVFGAVVAIFKWAWGFIKSTFDNIVNALQFVGKIFSAVFGPFVAIVKATFSLIGSILSAAWSFITAIFAAGVAVVKGIGDGFMTILRAIFNWGPIKYFIDTIKLGWQIFVEFLRKAWEDIQEDVTRIWGNVKTFFSDMWNGIWNGVKEVWNTITNWLSSKWNGTHTDVKIIWNLISQTISEKWEQIKGYVKAGVDKIVEIINTFKRVVDRIKGFFDDMKTAANGGIGDLIRFFGEIPGKVIDKLGNLGNTLKNAGRDLIRGLINGVDDMLDKLWNKFKDITDKIPKIKGPKAKDLKLLVNPGKWVMQGFMNGIESMLPNVYGQLAAVTNAIGTTPYAPVGVEPRSAINQSAPTSTTQNFYITTQEIDPRVHAAQLGWEIERRAS